MPERMYQYHFRIQAKKGMAVVRLAVLTDDNPNWRPGPWEEDHLGCKLRFEYLSCKLLDFKEEELLASAKMVSLLMGSAARPR